MQLHDAKCLCLTAVLLVNLVSSAHPYDEQPEEQQAQNANVRDKRTLNFFLKSFADAIGYDVQKRPSALPFGVQLAPVGLVNIIPPIGPVTPVKAPAAMGAAVAAPAVVVPAAPPAMAAAAPAAMVPAPAAMAPAPAVPPAPAAMVPAPGKATPTAAAPAVAPAPAGMAAAPAAIPAAAPAVAPAPAGMAPAPAAMPPAAGKATPAAPATAPAMPPAPGMPSAAPAAPAMPSTSPAAPAGKSAPLLTETIRKMFNLNFNWNRNLQPQINGVAPDASAAPAPQMPAVAGASAPQMPTAGAPSAAAPQMPAAPAAGQAVPAPAVPNIVPLAVPAAPMPAPMAPAMVPAPDMPPAAAPAPEMVPAVPEMIPAAPKTAPALPAVPTPPAASAPVPAVPAPLYYQPIQNVQFQPNGYQELQNINQPPIYYPNEQAALNEANSNENLAKDYSLPEAVQLFWQHSPWNRPQQSHVQNAVPEYRAYSTPDGERGYHVRRVQQNAHLQHHDLQPEDNDAEDVDESENNARERQEEEARSSEENDDANGDSSKAFLTVNNQPRGFQPAYAESRNQYQNGGFYQPGLPLAVHGIDEDKVLVAWPSPFELAGSEKKLKKVDPHAGISGAASDNLEYRYQPDNYDQFNFYTIPPPTKNQYDNYQTPSDPNVEETLSPNARIHENNYGKKYTTVHIDRQTYHH